MSNELTTTMIDGTDTAELRLDGVLIGTLEVRTNRYYRSRLSVEVVCRGVWVEGEDGSVLVDSVLPNSGAVLYSAVANLPLGQMRNNGWVGTCNVCGLRTECAVFGYLERVCDECLPKLEAMTSAVVPHDRGDAEGSAAWREAAIQYELPDGSLVWVAPVMEAKVPGADGPAAPRLIGRYGSGEVANLPLDLLTVKASGYPVDAEVAS